MLNPKKTKDNPPVIVEGLYQRDDHATFDEVTWIYETLALNKKRGTIIDIGAHKNSFFGCFAHAGWEVQAVEPFNDHYETLRRRWQYAVNVKIHGCAISNASMKSAPFYKSSISDGLHSLSAFDSSHRFYQPVQVKTLAQLVEEEEISSIDLLKIDVEGLELEVLGGMCWDRVIPECVVCEFDDGKFSGNPGRAVEIMEFLLAKGYHVLVSHWHRVLRYGIPHDWKALGVAPCYSSLEDGWGNFIAVRDPEVLGDLENSVRKYIRFRPKDECLVPAEGTIELLRNAIPDEGRERLVIFGAGGAGIHACRQYTNDSETVVAFIDNDPAKHHCALMGRPVFPVEYLKKLDYNRIVVSSHSTPKIYEQLISLGVDMEKISLHATPSAPNLLKDWMETHSKRLERFRNCHAGEDCFILGNGPSLLNTDLGALSLHYVFGLNKIHLLFSKMPLHIDYHVAINPHVIQQCRDVFGKQNYTSFLSYKPAKDTGLEASDKCFFIHTGYGYGFSRDITELVHEGCTVTHVALQIACFMGFENIFLVGVDHRFKVEGNPNEAQKMGPVDVNHFDPNYFANQIWQLPDLKGSEFSYRQAHLAYQRSQPPRRIFDATIGGALEVFPKLSFEEAVARCRPKSGRDNR
jgi:FkbM family methyltransferase